MAEATALKYRAFISYSHTDTQWAKWLHGAIEGFRVDRDIAGRETETGKIPTSLRPVFRDRDEFIAGGTLGGQTIAALDASAALIVLCSPRAATSAAVNEEIRLFRERRPGRPVIPVIVAGTPDSADEECFPAALRFKIGPGGRITDTPEPEIIAADARAQGDGKELTLAKVIARMLGLGTDDVFRRAERENKRKARVRNAVAAAIVVLSLAGGIAFWDAQRKGETIAVQEQERSEALAIARQLLGANPAAAATPGQEQNLVSALTAIQESAAAGDSDYAKALELLRAGKGADAVPLLLAAAEAKKKRAVTENKESAKAYREAATIAAIAEPWRARELFAEAARLDPSDLDGLYLNGSYQKEAGQLAAAESSFRTVVATAKSGTDDWALYWAQLGLGDIATARGDLNESKLKYTAAQTLAQSITAADPTNIGWQRDLSVSHEKIGNVLFAEGKLAEALVAYNESLAIRQRVSATNPAYPDWQRDVSAAHDKIGDVLSDQGKLTEAIAAYEASLAIRERLAKDDPTNAAWRRNLALAHDNVGDVLADQGRRDDALAAYRTSLAIREHLAAADPGNAEWERDLSVSHSKIGTVLQAQGKNNEALAAYTADLAIAERLAKNDPTNAGWQRDLSVSHNKIGEVLASQGKHEAALAAYTASLAIAERLAKTDPTNGGWQRDLAISHNKVGDVLSTQDKHAEALPSYQAALAITERLAKVDPANAEWQRDLGICNERIGNVHAQKGDQASAREAFSAALRIYDALAAANPDDVVSRLFTVAPRWRLAQLDPEHAVEHLRAALAVLKPLEAEQRLDATRQTWIPEIESQLAGIEGNDAAAETGSTTPAP
ncbi:MAG: tetratricopeptide repeat protein [Hyphomicrobium sp.]|uniref:toll/interleukin-1 receptor domain-containing protein n=1 Tax=Hyphomicrobium sp. TaxID=82 RepID=UPI003D131F9F